MMHTKYSLLVTFVREGENRHQVNQVVVYNFVSQKNPKRNTSTSTYKSFVMKDNKLVMHAGSVNGQYVGAHFEIFIDMVGKPHVNVVQEVGGPARKIYFRLIEEEVDLK